MTITIARAIAAAAETLAAAGFDTPRLDAEILLRHALSIDRTQLFVRLQEILPEPVGETFDNLLKQRLGGAPVAYIVGMREFMGLPFRVGPGVLTPRPETELLVERALEWLHQRPGATVLDVGTGSGAIAVSIASRATTATVTATEFSPEAAAWAAINITALAPHVALLNGDLIDAIVTPVDLLLANLPYLTPAQLAGNPDLEAEPEIALVSGGDGLDLIRRLVADAPRVMHSGGAIGLEIDPSQAAEITRIAHETFPDAIIDVMPDLAGLDRHVWIQLA